MAAKRHKKHKELVRLPFEEIPPVYWWRFIRMGLFNHSLVYCDIFAFLQPFWVGSIGPGPLIDFRFVDAVLIRVALALNLHIPQFLLSVST